MNMPTALKSTHADRVALPVHLLLRVDHEDAVDHALDRREEALARCVPSPSKTAAM